MRYPTSILRRVALLAIATSGLGLLGCGSDDSTGGDILQSGSDEGTVTVTPSGVSTQPVPSDLLWPSDADNLPVLYLAPLSGNRYLVGSQATDYPGWGEQVAWFTADSGGEWEQVDSPPVEGVVQEGGLVRSDVGAMFAALVCPSVDALTEPSEPGTTCEGGYRGIELWSYSDESQEWSEAGQFEPSAFEVDDTERASLSVLGVANENVYLSVGHGTQDRAVFRVRTDSEPPERVLTAGPGTFLKCVTAQQRVVAIVDDSVVSEEVEDFEGEPQTAGIPPRLAWTNDKDELVVAEELSIPGGLAACGAETAAVLGSRAPLTEAMRFEWVEVSTDDGSVVEEIALPEAANQSDPTEVVTTKFIGEGTDDYGLVIGGALDPTRPSRVVILPSLGAEPLEHTFEANEMAPQVMAAARLESGEVVVLLAATTAEADRLQLLVAS